MLGVPSSAGQWSHARLAELFRAMVTKFDIKWVPQVHIRYRAKKYLAETKFRMADCITLWRIAVRGLVASSDVTQDMLVALKMMRVDVDIRMMRSP